MKIWKLNFEVDEYDNLIPIKNFSFEELHSFDGRSHLSEWKPIKVKRMEPEKKLPLSDAPGFTFPVFSRKALDCLSPLIGNSIEALPLDFNEGEYFIINVLEVLDAIDYEKSDYITFSDGKKIMFFEKYAFLPNVIKDVHLFKITDENKNFPFVSDEFKNIVESNNLSGFIFKLVWSDEK